MASKIWLQVQKIIIQNNADSQYIYIQKVVPAMGAAMYEELLSHAADPMLELLTGALGEPDAA